MKKILVIVSALVSLFASPAGAQPPAATPPAAQEPVDSHTIIRSETRLVLVDSVVTDKKGAYVHGLTQKDFKVWEDNKEQQITTFSFETGATPDPSRKHYLVLFFDNSTASPSEQVYARDAATKFIDKNAGPNRLMSIVEFGGSLKVSQNFTDDADRLKKVVAGVKFSSVGPASGGMTPGGRGGGPSGREFTNYSTRGVLGALRNMAKGLSDVPGRKTLVFLSAGFRMTQDVISEVTATIDACNRSNVAIYPIDIRGLVAPTIGGVIGSISGPGSLSQLAMLNTARLAGPVAFWQGRGGTGGGTTTSGGGGTSTSGGGGARSGPTSPGLGGGNTGGSHPTTGPSTGTSSGNRTGVTTGNATNAARGATGGGATTNPLNPGLRNPNLNAILPPLDNGIGGNQQVLYALANGTGGFVLVNSNDILGGLEKIGREQNEYYILGYTPSKESDPGACHTLRVKVDKGGSQVRARTGYCETKTPDILSGTPAERELTARMASNEQPTVAASMQAPFFYTSANTARVDVALDIPPGAIVFAKEKGQERATMNVVGIAYLPDGGVGARFSDTVKLAFEDAKEMQAFSAKPYHYEKQFEAAPGKYMFKVVFSSSAQQFGKVEMPLVIEPWETTQFALSGLALSRDVRPAKDTTGGLFSELLEDRVPLVVNGVRMTPTGSNRFRKSEKGYLYAEIYEPALTAPDTKEAPVLGVQLKLLDGKTGEVKKDFGVVRLNDKGQIGNPAVPLGLVLNSDDLAPGMYKISVTAMDAAGRQFTRITPVEITN